MHAWRHMNKSLSNYTHHFLLYYQFFQTLFLQYRFRYATLYSQRTGNGMRMIIFTVPGSVWKYTDVLLSQEGKESETPGN